MNIKDTLLFSEVIDNETLEFQADVNEQNELELEIRDGDNGIGIIMEEPEIKALKAFLNKNYPDL